MCNFTPVTPEQLPTSEWTSYDELLCLYNRIAGSDQLKATGMHNLKSHIVTWYPTLTLT